MNDEKPRKTVTQRIFGSRAKALEASIDRYVSVVERIGLILEEAIKKYLDDDLGQFEEKRGEVTDLERQADQLRRDIKYRLYAEMLIPDSRGDVLALLETLDNINDRAKYVSGQISIETPEIYPFLKDDFRELIATCVKAVGETALGCRAFFREPYRVTEHVEKVHHWEHEADEIEERIKRKAFTAEKMKMFRRVHIRYFAEQISRMADEAEEVADRLSIYAIKRSM